MELRKFSKFTRLLHHIPEEENYRELGKYISCGNTNIPPDKMSGRSKIVSNKTEFLNFQPDKYPMSGAISRLGYMIIIYQTSVLS